MNAKQIITAAIGALTTMTPAFAFDGAWIAGLGLPQVFLWVLAFAVVYAVLTKTGVLDKKSAAIVAIVTGFYVLMAAPAAVVSVIANMSTGLVVLAVGIIALVAVLEISGAEKFEKDQEGKITARFPYLKGHSTAVAAILLVLAAVMFVAAGGLPLIGIAGIPVIGYGTWLLIIVGIAVLWMLS
jgi:hypothetical protein